MTIKLDCTCGKSLKVGDDKAGKKVRCPSCQAVLTVPLAVAAEEEEDRAGYSLEETLVCKCKRHWPLGTVVCTECGYNFKTGKTMKTVYQVRDRYVEWGVRWLGTYTVAAVNRMFTGDLHLVIRKRLLFFPFRARVIDLKGYDKVLTDAIVSESEEGLDYYKLEIVGPRKKPLKIYSGTDENVFRDLTDLLQKSAGLQVERK